MNIEFLLNTSSAGSAYVGWTPQPSSLKLTVPQAQGMNVRLKCVSAAGAGSVSFRLLKGDAPLPELDAVLPGDGTAFNFFVAGATASLADQDTLINVVDAVTGAVLLSRTVMVRIRKNANELSPAERDRFLAAIYAFNISTGNPDYTAFLTMHNDKADNEIHTTSPVTRYSFLVWHRAFVLDLERRLQKIDPSVAIPYWKFDSPAPKVFSPDFMGGVTATGTLQFNAGNPLAHWRIGKTIGITREPGFNDQTESASNAPGFPALSEDQTVRLGTTFKAFRSMENNPHGAAHASFSNGPITTRPTATQDPIFFLLHANVDRLWALWQQKLNRYTITDVQTYPIMGSFAPGKVQHIGDFVDDTMWPWNDIVTGGRPPSAPSTPFPASSSFSQPSAMPEVWEMIDYQGIEPGTAPNGADYDHILFT